MIFEYDAEEVYTKQLDIVDIGNTSLRCVNKDLVEYYLITKTVMGKTAILKFGPIVADMNVLLNNFSVSYKKVDYKEATINKEILFFINDNKKKITDIEEITDFEAFKDFPNIQDGFNNL